MAEMADLQKDEKEQNRKQQEEEITKKIQELPLNERVKAVSLLYYLNEKQELDTKLEKQLQELTYDFEQKTIPLNTKASEIIQGKRVLTNEELEELDTYLNEGEKEKLGEVEDKQLEPISEYWLKCLKNCSTTSPHVLPKDEAVLKHLSNIEYVIDEKTKLDFTVTFYFSQNDYFTNESLTKKFIMQDEGQPERSEGCEIQWNEGKNLTKKTIKKKQKNKKSGQQRTITKEVDDESFFLFFNTSSTAEDKDLDEEEQTQALERMDIDYEVGQVLVDEIVPYSLEYYLDVKEADEDGYEDEDDEGFEDDDDEDDDDDDDEDAKMPKMKKPIQGNKKKKDDVKSEHKKSYESNKSNEDK